MAPNLTCVLPGRLDQNVLRHRLPEWCRSGQWQDDRGSLKCRQQDSGARKSQPTSPRFSWQGPDGSPLGGLVVNSSHDLCRSRSQVVVNFHWPPRRDGRPEPCPSLMPGGCLVKPVAAWADFLRPTWNSPIRGLLLQPELFLSAARALVWEIVAPPKGLGIL